MTNAIDAIRIQNRDKRLTDYQAELAALRAENARLREVLGAIVTRMEWHSNAIGWRVKHDLPAGTITQARAVLAEVSK